MNDRDSKVANKKPLKNKTKVLPSKAKSSTVVKEKTKKSKKEILAESKKKFEELIRFARLKGWDLAADNLEFWFKNKNPNIFRKIPIRHFEKEDFIIQHIKKEHVTLILKGIENRIKAPANEFFPKTKTDLLGGNLILRPAKNELRNLNKTTLYYQNTVYAPNDNELYFALGGFTVLSEVSVKREEINLEGEISNIITIISWKCRIYDKYNWDKGKAVLIPLYGKIYDEELIALEENGIGNDYDMLSDSWNIDFVKIGVPKEYSPD